MTRRGRQEEGWYVYNMGNSERVLAGFCARPPAEALFSPPGRYFVVCPGRIKVRPEYYPKLKNALMKKNPRMVLWPPANGCRRRVDS